MALTIALTASVVSTMHLESMVNSDNANSNANANANFHLRKTGLKALKLKMYSPEKFVVQLIDGSFITTKH